MRLDRTGRRKLWSATMAVLCSLCLVAALVPLVSILGTAAVRGIEAMNLDFFTLDLPPACNPGISTCYRGGILNAIQGSLIMVGLAALMAVPLGILAGIFLAEYRHLRIVPPMRFLVEVMTGLPSIVVGIFVFSLFLDLSNQGAFDRSWVLSGFAGAAALAVIMVPIVARTTDEALRLVPTSLREAGLALGLRRWRVTTSVVVSTGRASVITGTLLAVARAGGETAPLLVVTTFAQYPVHELNGPIAALPPLIYFFGLSGYANWIQIAWGASLVVVGIMLAISVAARVAAGLVGRGGELRGGRTG